MARNRLVRFERSGGLTGCTFTFDLSLLETEEADHVNKMLEQSGLVEISSGIRSVKHRPDQFDYTFVFESDNMQQAVVLNESDVPETLWPLIIYLVRKARKK